MNLSLCLWLMFTALVVFGIWIFLDSKVIWNLREILEKQKDFDAEIIDWTRSIEARLQALEDRLQELENQDFS